MAGISQKVSPDEILPLLGHNVWALGYTGYTRPTEYLNLLNAYLQQARELTVLAGQDRVIHVSSCADAGPLLQILGYRQRGGCGDRNTALETADAERAFLTTDSGFPLPELEQAIQENQAFSYPYAGSSVPAFCSEAEVVAASAKNRRSKPGLVEIFLQDPEMARLYFALSRVQPEVRVELLRSVGLRNLVRDAAALDFYGGRLGLRSGGLILPGGPNAEASWKELVGTSPNSPGKFVNELFSRDKGWMAAYFDALSHLKQGEQAYFTEPRRLRLFYEALRPANNAIDATRGTFQPEPALLVLVTRLRLDADGQPHVPGNLEVWKRILSAKKGGHVPGGWSKPPSQITTAENLVQDLFSLSRTDLVTSPLRVYLGLSALDSRRPEARRLSPATVEKLAAKFSDYSDQYRIFGEFPELNEESISLFLETAERLSRITDAPVRGNAMGAFQASLGIWQILARQGQIPASAQNDSWQKTVRAFVAVHSATQVFDAGRTSLREVLSAAAHPGNFSQEELIQLLAGPPQSSPEGQAAHQELANRIRSIMDSQRLVSLDSLFALGDGLKDVSLGKPADASLGVLAGELREFELPRPIFTRAERTTWGSGVYNNHHTDTQMRTDLSKVLKNAASRSQVEEARGQLAPFLRDTLVGLNYAYYEPPGAQLLYTNPLFVRQHDFSGETVSGVEHLWQCSSVFGAGSPAGGGAHLVGSLADLPYVLADAEQDFLAPQNVQALIFRELVPGLLTSAVLPRWWEVTPSELHAAGLYQRSGEELLSAAMGNSELRQKIMRILSDRMSPEREDEIERSLRSENAGAIREMVTPADSFFLAAEFRSEFPQDAPLWGPASRELNELSQSHPADTSRERLALHFGIPHPVLTQSYTRELLNVEPFPPFAGEYSRLLAESWDSSNLYWARLADETGQSPAALHHLVPELTRRMIEKIFASQFEDWPALLRAMRETGEEYKQGKVIAAQVGGAQP
jgi:hypothetical protein